MLETVIIFYSFVTVVIIFFYPFLTVVMKKLKSFYHCCHHFFFYPPITICLTFDTWCRCLRVQRDVAFFYAHEKMWICNWSILEHLFSRMNNFVKTLHVAVSLNEHGGRLFPCMQGFWGKVWRFIPHMLFKKKKKVFGDQLAHTSSTRTTIAKCSLSSCICARSLIGYAMPQHECYTCEKGWILQDGSIQSVLPIHTNVSPCDVI